MSLEVLRLIVLRPEVVKVDYRHYGDNCHCGSSACTSASELFARMATQLLSSETQLIPPAQERTKPTVLK